MSLKTAIKSKITNHYISKEQMHEEYLNIKDLPSASFSPLSDEEKKSAIQQWGGVQIMSSFKELEVFKHYNGFDSRYLSHYLYLPLVARTLNNYHYTKFFENKGLLDYLCKSGICFPKSFVRRIDNEYYDADMQQIDYSDAIKILADKDVLIVKDSVDSAGGKSVSKLNLADINGEERAEVIKREFGSRKSDFVVQECVRQSKTMARFNENSVNTLRITTLYLNGDATVCNTVLRFGKPHMMADNWGLGGILCGVAADGRLRRTGYDIRLNPFTECNGIPFEETVISELPEIIPVILATHKESFSLCKFIGWDVCIAEDGTPCVIEVNSSQPGIFGEQLCNGPIFGERTQEVIEYIKTKPFVYNRALVRF